MFIDNEKVLSVQEFLKTLKTEIQEYPKVKKIKRKTGDIMYYNIPCAFDIETSSFYEGEEKRAIMYHWQFGINGHVVFGRTWIEFTRLYNEIVKIFNTDLQNRLVIYVHNFAYEFQFICKWLEWENVFALKERKVAYGVTKDGIEIRCSYILSGKSLAKLSSDLQTHKCAKMTGDLDYDKLRNSKTPLTPEEQKYCENDVRVIMSYIQEKIENGEDLAHIPMTKTGYVRRFCRDMCLRANKANNYAGKKYRGIINELTISGPEEYDQLKRAFQGGFTHASFNHVMTVCKEVASFDFSSSYPAVMIAEQFPMSAGKIVKIKNKEHFRKLLNTYCCVFDIELHDIRTKENCPDDYLSESKCYVKKGITINNGRIYKADMIRTTITNVDYAIIEKCYDFDQEQIGIENFRIYRKGYLPTSFVNAVVTLYEDKTTLKGIDDMYIEYMLKKEMLNACYGMSVTDIIRDLIEYNITGWNTAPADKHELIDKYNNDKSRFLFYPWGIFITAYARRNLWSGIIAMGEDYIYSDTDSLKIMNKDKHMQYINNYNTWITKQVKKACEYHSIDPARCTPKTIKGIEKPIGVWDYEGTYTRFKTLGAKRYMVEKDNEIELTVAGVNKKECRNFLIREYGKDKVFDVFTENLLIPASGTGKQTHTYCDYEIKGNVTDYLGNTAKYHENTFIHLEGAEYNFTISSDYIDFINGYYEGIL